MAIRVRCMFCSGGDPKHQVICNRCVYRMTDSFRKMVNAIPAPPSTRKPYYPQPQRPRPGDSTR